MAKTIFEEMGGRIHSYLSEIDGQAQERFERLVEGMKQAQGITEKRLRMDWENEQYKDLCEEDCGDGNHLRIDVTHKELKSENRC